MHKRTEKRHRAVFVWANGILNRHNPKVPHHAKALYAHIWVMCTSQDHPQAYYAQSIKQLSNYMKMCRKSVIDDIYLLENTLKLIKTRQKVIRVKGNPFANRITAFRVLSP